jgi:hypothetical protein
MYTRARYAQDICTTQISRRRQNKDTSQSIFINQLLTWLPLLMMAHERLYLEPELGEYRSEPALDSWVDPMARNYAWLWGLLEDPEPTLEP